MPDATDELCTRWEEWSKAMARAAEVGGELPQPPVPRRHDRGTTQALLRIMEASAYAAGALARAIMGLRRSGGAVQGTTTERGDADPATAEVERLKSTLRDLETRLQESQVRRYKEVEDALWVASQAETKQQEMTAVLRQLLGAQGDASAAVAAAGAGQGGAGGTGGEPPGGPKGRDASLGPTLYMNTGTLTPAVGGKGTAAATWPRQGGLLFSAVDAGKAATIDREEFARAYRAGVFTEGPLATLATPAPRGRARDAGGYADGYADARQRLQDEVEEFGRALNASSGEQ